KVRPDAPISPALEAVILRALAKSPEDRHGSARELAEAIAAARDQPQVFAPHQVSNPDEIAQSDTDLHIEQQVLGQARTLRADEVAALAEQEAGLAPPSPAVVVRGGRPHDVAAPAARPRGGFMIEDEATTVTGNAPARSYVWAVVAVVA